MFTNSLSCCRIREKVLTMQGIGSIIITWEWTCE